MPSEQVMSTSIRSGKYYAEIKPFGFYHGDKPWCAIHLHCDSEVGEVIVPISCQMDQHVSDRLECIAQSPPHGLPKWFHHMAVSPHWADIGCSLPYMVDQFLLKLKLQY